MIKENQKTLNRLTAMLDALCVLVSLILAWYIRFESGLISVSEWYLPYSEYIKPAVFIIPLYLFLYSSFQLYTPHRLKSIADEIYNILKSNILGLLIFILALYVFKEIHYSRYMLLIFGITCTIITSIERTAVRLIMRRIRKEGLIRRNIIIVGLSSLTADFIKLVEDNRHWGYNIIGILDDNQEQGYRTSKKEIIGRVKDLEEFLCTSDIDEVFITLELKEYEKVGNIIEACEHAGVRAQIIPDYYRYIPARPYVEEVEGLPIINIRYIPLDNIANKLVKRLFDIFASMGAIIIFSPVMLLTAVIIKFTSPGPVIYKQERVGFNKKVFSMYKFRSMRVQENGEDKITWTTKDDPRKTRFGEFIRKTSIDELPQLFNVLCGDMSLVGPRPERPFFVEQFKEEVPKYMIKHQVRPGITGWAQVNGLRGDTSIKKRIEYDLYYIENWALLLDIKIMFLTVFKGFINENAY